MKEFSKDYFPEIFLKLIPEASEGFYPVYLWRFLLKFFQKILLRISPGFSLFPQTYLSEFFQGFLPKVFHGFLPEIL